MKRYIVFVFLFLVSFALVVIAEEPKQNGDYSYCVLENGSAEITSYNGKAASIVIPPQLDG